VKRLPRKGNEFGRVFLEAVDEGLSLLGGSAKDSIYHHLEKSFGLRKEEILDKPEVLSDCLRKIFGAGASVIEKSILRSLHSKLGLQFKERGKYRFSDYIREARRRGD
jgi:hypothetical protein